MFNTMKVCLPFKFHEKYYFMSNTIVNTFQETFFSEINIFHFNFHDINCLLQKDTYFLAKKH